MSLIPHVKTSPWITWILQNLHVLIHLSLYAGLFTFWANGNTNVFWDRNFGQWTGVALKPVLLIGPWEMIAQILKNEGD